MTDGLATTPLPPEACRTMDEVRAGVDALDRALLDLLAARMGYMEAAARIKDRREAVRDEARKREVIANAVARAEALGLDAQWIARWWDQLVERSIAHEFDVWDRTRATTSRRTAAV